MKTAGLITIAGAVLSVVSMDTVAARPLHAKLNYRRYLQERDDTKAAVEEYKKSAAYRFAIENGIWSSEKETRDGEEAGEATEDEIQRFHIAKETVKKLSAENPDATFSTDSPFTLMTEEEFSKFVAPAGDESEFVMSAAPVSTEVSQHVPLKGKNCDFEVDWKEKGCISPIKNQGTCGSCWAFAAIAAVESAQCIKGQPLNSYSEQHLMTCDNKKNKACTGGSPSAAMDFIANTGLCAEKEVPYTGVAGTCAVCTPTKVPVSLKRLERKDTTLANAVRQQPVIVLVSAGNNAWKQYKGGIISSCETKKLDHAVLAYGFSADAFLIKNSWGALWGESGFVKLRRGVEGNGTCQIYENMMYPEVGTARLRQ